MGRVLTDEKGWEEGIRYAGSSQVVRNAGTIFHRILYSCPGRQYIQPFATYITTIPSLVVPLTPHTLKPTHSDSLRQCIPHESGGTRLSKATTVGKRGKGRIASALIDLPIPSYTSPAAPTSPPFLLPLHHHHSAPEGQTKMDFVVKKQNHVLEKQKMMQVSRRGLAVFGIWLGRICGMEAWGIELLRSVRSSRSVWGEVRVGMTTFRSTFPVTIWIPDLHAAVGIGITTRGPGIPGLFGAAPCLPS